MGYSDCSSELATGHVGLALFSILLTVFLTSSCFKPGFPGLACAASVRGPYPGNLPTLRCTALEWAPAPARDPGTSPVARKKYLQFAHKNYLTIKRSHRPIQGLFSFDLFYAKGYMMILIHLQKDILPLINSSDISPESGPNRIITGTLTTNVTLSSLRPETTARD